MHRDIALEAPFDGDLVEAMVAAAAAPRTPSAAVLPYCLSGGTDNKALSRLGITGYGFAPLRLPADLDFAPMFHGIDERVPVDVAAVRRAGAAAARSRPADRCRPGARRAAAG